MISKSQKISQDQKLKIKKNLLELEESLFKPKRYYDYDGTEYKGIRNLSDPTIDEDHCKPVKSGSDFHNNNNYTEYESNGDRDKTYTLQNI